MFDEPICCRAMPEIYPSDSRALERVFRDSLGSSHLQGRGDTHRGSAAIGDAARSTMQKKFGRWLRQRKFSYLARRWPLYLARRSHLIESTISRIRSSRKYHARGSDS